MSGSEKRQRVIRACDDCKRKKKQCTGSQPCTLCITRSRPCVFSSLQLSRNNNQRAPEETTQAIAKRKCQSLDVSQQEGPAAKKGFFRKELTTEDETSIQNDERLLQDSDGRLLYIGDSASLSFLQSIRRLVEGSVGPSSFTTDSSRHKILEASILTDPRDRIACMLPDIEAAHYLVNSFFQNTIGLVQIFNKEDFMDNIAKTYQQPLDASPPWLCQLNLVFAIGLQMRRVNRTPEVTESQILSRLGAENARRSEIFFLAAKHLNDSICGFEEGGIEAVQSLLLMAIYMLTASKRNTAWVYLGMAVRLAYSLGIHKQETLLVFTFSEQTARVDLWQSLHIMDCFLSASLGRPSSITCGCASESCPSTPLYQSWDLPPAVNSLQHSVAASKIIGEILTRIYHKRKASRSVAYMLTLNFSKWTRELPAELHWRYISSDPTSPELTVKRLHINLIYFHGVILLTRPFFLHQISIRINGHEDELRTRAQNSRSEGKQRKNEAAHAFCFHGACVRSAVHTITAVHSGLISRILPIRDPFIIYWMFSASLIILANAFCPVFLEPETEALICKTLNIFNWYGEADAQARRYQSILESFNDVIQSKKKPKRNENESLDSRNIFDALFGSVNSSSTSQEGPTSVHPQASIDQWEVGDKNHMTTLNDVIPGLGGGSYETDLDGMVLGEANWQPNVCDGIDELIDFDGAWFPGGQKNFVPTSGVQVPLYNLMDTF